MSQSNQAKIIVIGNEKGGSGKTTTSMHTIMGLLHEGFKVSSIDLDNRQRSLSNYIENRRNYIIKQQINLPFPNHFIVNNSALDSKHASRDDELDRFNQCLERASSCSDFVIIDCPGNDTNLSRVAHSYGDLIITPVNDSFIDLNILANVKDDTLSMDLPGVYSEVIWDAKKQRAKRDRSIIDWVIVRNRLSNLNAHNKKNVSTALLNLSKRLGFRLSNGFSERVIYKELYLKGLTLLDVLEQNVGIKVTVSHIAARQELRDFLDFLNIPNISQRISDNDKEADEQPSSTSEKKSTSAEALAQAA